MDLGLYNKSTVPRGEHGTLIGNWVEERSLQQTTGFTRYEDLTQEKLALRQTQDRIITHRDNADYHLSPTDKVSITKSTYVEHGPEHFTEKIYNQTGSHWHHDVGGADVGGGAASSSASSAAAASSSSQQPKKTMMNKSQITFGDYTTPVVSTHTSTFTTPQKVIIPKDKLKLQQDSAAAHIRYETRR